MAAIFIDGLEQKLSVHNKVTRGTSQTSFEKIRPVVLEEIW